MEKNIYYIGSHWIFGKGNEFILLFICIDVFVPSQESEGHVICFYDHSNKFWNCSESVDFFLGIFFKFYWYIRLYKNTNVRKKINRRWK